MWARTTPKLAQCKGKLELNRNGVLSVPAIAHRTAAPATVAYSLTIRRGTDCNYTRQSAHGKRCTGRRSPTHPTGQGDSYTNSGRVGSMQSRCSGNGQFGRHGKRTTIAPPESTISDGEDCKYRLEGRFRVLARESGRSWNFALAAGGGSSGLSTAWLRNHPSLNALKRTRVRLAAEGYFQPRHGLMRSFPRWSKPADAATRLG